MPKTALVAGSTGLVGQHLVKCLANSHEYEVVIAVVRKNSNLILDGVITIEVDYEQLFNHVDELQADVVFCCLGTTMKKAGNKANFHKVDFTFPLELAKIAEKNQSTQFNIITASGANSKSLFYYNRVKGDIEKAISKLNLSTINIFRPSLLLGERNEHRKGEKIGAKISKIINPLLVGRLKKYRAIQVSVVANAMYKVSLQESQGTHTFESDRIQELGSE